MEENCITHRVLTYGRRERKIIESLTKGDFNGDETC